MVCLLFLGLLFPGSPQSLLLRGSRRSRYFTRLSLGLPRTPVQEISSSGSCNREGEAVFDDLQSVRYGAVLVIGTSADCSRV